MGFGVDLTSVIGNAQTGATGGAIGASGPADAAFITGLIGSQVFGSIAMVYAKRVALICPTGANPP